MDRKLSVFVFLIGLFVVSLFFGGETKSDSVEKTGFSAPVSSNGLDVFFFYGQGCPHCVKVEPFLAKMEQKYPLRLHRFDIYSNRSCLSLFDEYSSMYGLPLERRGVPTVFVSDAYFVGDDAILGGFEEVVKKALQESSSANHVLEVESSEGSDRTVTSVTSSLSFVTVTVAALVDAVSPCSIAILVFLVGARVLVADRRKRALKVGLAFCLSVFIAYFLFGLGLFTVVQVSGFSNVFSLLAGLVAVLAGVFYLKDVFWYGKGGFVMEVPGSLKPLLMKMLKGVASPFGAFVMGFVVCLFELPCTGGPYLFILGQLANSTTRLQAIPLLLYYNFIFALPLVMISLLLYSNLFSISKVREWNDKNRVLVRLLGGFAMIGLGFLVMPVSLILQSILIFLSIFKAVGPPFLTIMFLYLVVSYAKHRNLGHILTGTMLISVLATVFTISSPSNILSSGIESGGCIVVKVEYNDGQPLGDNCPRSGAEVLIYDYPNPGGDYYLGGTGEDGMMIRCDHTVVEGEYSIYACVDGCSVQFGPDTYLVVDNNGDGSTTIRDWDHSYPNGTESCGDSECDGLKYCYIPEVGDPYVECDSWDTECDTKKCCQCDGGTPANPTENYDETQDEDCGPGYECSDIDTCSPVPGCRRIVNQTSPACTTGDIYYSTIQSAVDAANDGDEIIVCPGTYTEQIDVFKSLDISSYEGSENTIVNASGSPEFGFELDGLGLSVNLTGFTIIGASGYAGMYPASAVVVLNSPNSIISNNNITGNKCGILVYQQNRTIIENNSITLNNLGSDSYGILIVDNSNNNTIRYNNIMDNAYGIFIDGDPFRENLDNMISYNNIYDNDVYDFGNQQSSSIDAPNNWWGTTTCSVIDGNIFDDNESSYGKVDFSPPLSDPYPGGSPVVEVCDGIDNDCDETIDETCMHDIAVTAITLSKTIVGQGYSTEINVTVQNQGNFAESFNVSVFYDDIAIILPDGENHTTTTLTSQNSTTLTIPWNTTGVAKGNYTITAYAEPIPGETDTTDNTLTNGWILVTIPGDVNGDCVCDMADISMIIDAFMTYPGDPKWDADCDVNCDGVVDMADISIAIDNFMKTCQDP